MIAGAGEVCPSRWSQAEGAYDWSIFTSNEVSNGQLSRVFPV